MSEASKAVPTKFRRPTKGWRLVSVAFPIASLLLASLFIFHWRPFGFVLIDLRYLYYLLALFVPLCYLWNPISSKAPKDRVPWYDIVLMVLAVIAPVYLASQHYSILFRGWVMGAPPVPTIFCVILWGLMIEAGRRSGGPVFASFILFFSCYPLFADHMPGFLQSQSFSFKHVAAFNALGEDSLRGIPFRVFGRLVFGFMFFAAAIQALGAGKFFTQVATILVGKTRAGNAKVAIVASGFFASISGSSAANVMTTGAFTIPAMKREGLPAHFAGGVEASASAGGTLTPPVMGATAFILSEFIEVPYAEVCIAAAIPAILYFTCLFSQIDAFAARKGIKPPPEKIELPPMWRIFLNNFHTILAFIVLILLLFFLRLSSQGPWIATAVAIVLAMFRKETRLSLKGFITLLEDAGRILGNLLCIMAPVGLIIGGFILTGTAFSLPHQIVGLAGGNVVLMLMLGAFTAFILGMGVTTSSVYIFLAIVLAPGLVTSGFELMSAHMFILYTAMWSHITPPVATAAFVAAGVAGSNPMRTGVEAMKLGVAKYILPIVFIWSPALILRGPVSDMLLVIPTTAIGLIIISAALEGYFWRMGNLTIFSRILLFGAGLLVAIPGLTTDVYGIISFVAIFGLAYFLRGRSPLANVLVHQQIQSET